MRLSTALLGALSVFSFVSAADVNIVNPKDSDVTGEYVDVDEVVPFQYDIKYKVAGKPESDVLEFFNSEEITLDYTFANHEDEEITVVGVGGNFANPLNGEVVANITDAKIGPIVIAAGESKQFSQRVGINLPADNYLLTPGLYIVRGSALALLGARTQLVIVDDKPISFFNPQLVVLELLLLATLSAGAYFVWINFGAAYFKTTVQTATVSKPSAKASGADVKVDQSWLPEVHTKKNQQKKN